METNWKEYVKNEAIEFGIPFQEAWRLFKILGPSEAHDGFITMLEDMEES